MPGSNAQVTAVAQVAVAEVNNSVVNRLLDELHEARRVQEAQNSRLMDVLEKFAPVRK